MKQEVLNTARRKIGREITNKKVILIRLLLKKVRYRMENRPHEDIEIINRKITSTRTEIENLEANLVILTL